MADGLVKLFSHDLKFSKKQVQKPPVREGEPTHGRASATVDHSFQKSSFIYFPPPSQRIVTTTASPSNFRASSTAANTFAPELGPTKRPSSRASRRVII